MNAILPDRRSKYVVRPCVVNVEKQLTRDGDDWAVNEAQLLAR